MLIQNNIYCCIETTTWTKIEESPKYKFQGLLYKIRAASDISQKGHFFLEKKNTKNITIPYSTPFLSVSHQNKALRNFYKWGQRPIAGHIKGLD